MVKDYIETGKIVGTHGIKGEVKVEPWSDSPQFLCEFNKFYITDDGKEYIDITGARVHGNIVLIKAKDIDSIKAAEALRGKTIYIKRTDINLEDGRYFVQDLIGCQVLDISTNENYGKIVEVSQTGANDVWHIKRDDKEYLIPVIPDVVIDVNLENSVIKIKPLKGIFDDED